MRMAPEGHCVIQLFFVKALWEQGRQEFKYTQDNGWKTVQTESEGPSQQLPAGVERGRSNAVRQRAVPRHKLRK